MLRNVLLIIFISTLIHITTNEELICHSELTDAASKWKVLFKESRADFARPNEHLINALLIIWTAMTIM